MRRFYTKKDCPDKQDSLLVIKGRTNLREHEQKLLKILHFYGMTHGFLNLKKEKLP